jgi:DNA-binding PadR family transcriptional regulator
MEIPLKPRTPTLPSTWDFIRSRLLLTKGDYAYSVWQRFSAYLVEVFGQKPPKYSSFAKYWWILKKLGLIEPIGPPRKGKGGKPRQFYRITPGKEPIEIWRKIGNPQAELDTLKGRIWIDPVTKERVPKSRLGARRYRRRVLKVPPKKVGRPRG